MQTLTASIDCTINAIEIAIVLFVLDYPCLDTVSNSEQYFTYEEREDVQLVDWSEWEKEFLLFDFV